jgi:hypothetical protein
MPRKADQTVTAYLAQLDHPLKGVVCDLRDLLLSVDPRIAEEVKWNAPSFRTREHFATMQLRHPKRVQLILHLGAKKQSQGAGTLQDPAGLLAWLGEDRAVVGFESQDDLKAKAPALRAIVQQWIDRVEAVHG